MKKLFVLVLTAGFALGTVGSSSAGAPTRVFEDPAGDAGIEGGSAVGQNSLPGFDMAGFDLVSGDLKRAGQNLEFKVTSAAMPPTGALPDGAVFHWHFAVDGERFRLSVKSQHIGKPDPIWQEGFDRVGQVDVDGHFRLETCEGNGELPGGFGLMKCELIALEDGSFDPATKSFTAIIPLKDIAASSGSVIGPSPAAQTRCQPCWFMPVAEDGTPAGFVLDGTDRPITYRVPKR